MKVSVIFFDAGHILGSALTVLELEEKNDKVSLCFTGDLGRKNMPILKDPEFTGDVDYLITESTYGNRVHESAEEIEKNLIDVITTAYSTNGKIIVPSFSVGRTQELIYEISKLTSKGLIPEIPVFVDSPLSVNATEIFKLHPECFDSETAELITLGVNIFGLNNVKYIQDVNESIKLNNFKGPCMIISASGMAEAGRILHHLANNIENKNNIILIIGFMAENTLGRKLVEAKNLNGVKVNIFGEPHIVKSKIIVLNSFSAHADKNELLKYINQYDKNKLRKIFLVHGEYNQQITFKDTLISNGYKNIEIPERGDIYELN